MKTLCNGHILQTKKIIGIGNVEIIVCRLMGLQSSPLELGQKYFSKIVL